MFRRISQVSFCCIICCWNCFAHLLLRNVFLIFWIRNCFYRKKFCPRCQRLEQKVKLLASEGDVSASSSKDDHQPLKWWIFWFYPNSTVTNISSIWLYFKYIAYHSYHFFEFKDKLKSHLSSVFQPIFFVHSFYIHFISLDSTSSATLAHFASINYFGYFRLHFKAIRFLIAVFNHFLLLFLLWATFTSLSFFLYIFVSTQGSFIRMCFHSLHPAQSSSSSFHVHFPQLPCRSDIDLSLWTVFFSQPVRFFVTFRDFFILFRYAGITFCVKATVSSVRPFACQSSPNPISNRPLRCPMSLPWRTLFVANISSCRLGTTRRLLKPFHDSS